ncbi:hypothetical protein II5_05994 [Bacillus cereus MSX-A1]|nr:hypothetical protein II5_05994 [Bacillus cereus MSX-A1]
MEHSNPEYFKHSAIKKQSKYIQINVKQILKQLQSRGTFELNHAYIGNRKRQARIAEKEKSKNRTYSKKNKIVAELNVCVTNIALEWIPVKLVHKFYTLR